MATKGVSIPTCTCSRCGYKWYLRRPQLPRVCPRCKSPYWKSDYEYKREFDIDMEKTVNINKELTKTMEKAMQDPQHWVEVIKIGWKRMFKTSDFPIKHLNRVLDGGFSVYSWFMNINKMSIDLIDDIPERLLILKRQISHSSADIDKIKKILQWEKVLENLNEEVVKVLAFLWFADALSSQVSYPEAEATIQGKAWSLIETNLAEKKEVLLEAIELVIGRIEENSEAATSWAEVIRLP